MAAPARVELGVGYRLTVPAWLSDGLDWLAPGMVHGVLGATGCVSLLPSASLEDVAAEYDAAVDAEDGRRALELGIRNFAVRVEGVRRPRLPEPAWRHLGVPEKEYVHVARIVDTLEIWSDDYYRGVVERLVRGHG